MVNVWDLEKQYCTHNLRGSSGVVNVTRFHPDSSTLKLYTCSVADCNIRVWDLGTSKSVVVFRCPADLLLLTLCWSCLLSLFIDV